MQQRLQHVYWIGGSPCSGKSSIADQLAVRHGWQVYHCDQSFDVHVERATPERQPWLGRVRTLVWDDFWMRPQDVQLRNVIEGYAEEFPMILDDLLALSVDRPIVAEGTALLPELVSEVLTVPRQAIWIVPTADFQREYYPRRGAWVQAVLDQCRQPEQALHNWMNRDIATAEHVLREAAARGFPVIVVDGSRSIEDNRRLVERHFGLWADKVSKDG